MRKTLLLLSKVCIFFMLSMLIGCGSPQPDQNIYVWIDVPIKGLRVPVDQLVLIEGHATTRNGISKIEVWVDFEILEVFESPTISGDLALFSTSWTPPGNGEFNIQSIAFTADGEASQPDSVAITVGEELVEATHTPIPTEITPTPVFTSTPTPTPTPIPDLPIAELWAEPQSISAGSCTMIHWHAENVESIIFGGASQAFDGFYEDCFCSSQVFSMTVNHLDGTQEIVYMTIDVTGECVTPTSPPAVDNTAPPAPAPGSPHNGADISCTSYVDLIWAGVTDQSGISEYQVELQRYIGSTWTPVSASPITGITNTTINVYVECGHDYRWRVRAIDGAGNIGTWSSWFTFSDLLS